MKLRIVLLALSFATEAQAFRYGDLCRDDRTTQVYPDPRSLPVCGSKLICPSHATGCTPSIRRRAITYPNCGALIADQADTEHFGACESDPPRESLAVAVGFRFTSLADCLDKTAKIDAIPAQVTPWMNGAGIDQSNGGREAFCRRLFPLAAIPEHPPVPPREGEGAAAPSTPGAGIDSRPREAVGSRPLPAIPGPNPY